MRTIIDVDRELLERVQADLRMPSLTATVTRALELVLERRREALQWNIDRMANLDDESRAAMLAAGDW